MNGSSIQVTPSSRWRTRNQSPAGTRRMLTESRAADGGPSHFRPPHRGHLLQGQRIAAVLHLQHPRAERSRIIAGQDRDEALDQDGAVVELGPDQVHGATMDAHAGGEGAGMGLAAQGTPAAGTGWMLSSRSCQAVTKPGVRMRMKPARHTSSMPASRSRGRARHRSQRGRRMAMIEHLVAMPARRARSSPNASATLLTTSSITALAPGPWWRPGAPEGWSRRPRSRQRRGGGHAVSRPANSTRARPGARPISADDVNRLAGALERGGDPVDPNGVHHQDHADAAVESAQEIHGLEAAGAGKPCEFRRQLPGTQVKVEHLAVGERARWVFDQPTACDVRQGLDAAGRDGGEAARDIDPSRRQDRLATWCDRRPKGRGP